MNVSINELKEKRRTYDSNRSPFWKERRTYDSLPVAEKFKKRKFLTYHINIVKLINIL